MIFSPSWKIITKYKLILENIHISSTICYLYGKFLSLWKIITNSLLILEKNYVLISEVHPFEDGNGRIARIMMNAELVNKDQSRIIIPTVFSDDYLHTLKKITNQKDPAPYIAMLTRTYQFSENLHFENYDDFYNYLDVHNAFYESEEGKHLKID